MKFTVIICVLLSTYVWASTEQDLDITNVQLNQRTDPCVNTKCGSGKECIINEETREAECICVRECDQNVDDRRFVCSSLNTTWQSDCHLLRHKCLCNQGKSDECDESHLKMSIDYYGRCKQREDCTDDVKSDFPRRMREWMYNIMDKPKSDVSLAEEPKTAKDHVDKWVDAIIWKFCSLDTPPYDRKVAREELFPLRAPLLSMEPCIADFLADCDHDDDGNVTIHEWGMCLGADIDELESKCTKYRQQ